jgi:hypothetical protein
MDAKLITDGNNNYSVLDYNNELVATTMESGFTNQKLSIKNCEAIKNGFDLDDTVDYFKKGKSYIQKDGVIILAGENRTDGIVIKDPLGTRGIGHYSDVWNPKAFCEYNQKALSILGDKKFSEEDMVIAIELARKGHMEEQHNGYGMSKGSRFVSDNLSPDSIIQSLQQTEWDVIVEMEVVSDFDSRAEFDGQVFSTNKKQVPKLDANDCLILKRKS